ncbi:MAG TPA: hypothetical protein VGO62_03800, partial [Myxococcota bacterium]
MRALASVFTGPVAVAIAIAIGAAAATHARAAPTLPDDVLVATTTDAVGLGEIYAVRDGALWMKKTGGAWSLYQGSGRVPGVARPIIAVFADEDEHFMVVTDDGGMHHH